MNLRLWVWAWPLYFYKKGQKYKIQVRIGTCCFWDWPLYFYKKGEKYKIQVRTGTCCFSTRKASVLIPLKQTQQSNGASPDPSAFWRKYKSFAKLEQREQGKANWVIRTNGSGTCSESKKECIHPVKSKDDIFLFWTRPLVQISLVKYAGKIASLKG